MDAAAVTDWVDDLSWLATADEDELPPGLRWPPDKDEQASCVDETLQLAACLGPGPEAIELLVSLRRQPLSDQHRLAVVELWQAQLAWVTGAEQAAILDLVGPAPEASDARACLEDEFAPAELAAALHSTTSHAADRIAQARLLHGTLRATGERLRAGTLDPYRVWLIVDGTKDLGDERRRVVESAVLGRPGADDDAAAMTGAALRAAVREACRMTDPDWSARQFARARTTRRVVFRPEGHDGLVGMHAYLPPTEALAVQRHLEQAAGRPATDPSDVRCHDERMADALMSSVLGSAPGDPTTPLMPDVQVQVLVPLSTLLELREQSGELVGYGPVPADVARELAEDADWQRWVFEDASGHLVDLGKHRYRPGEALAAFVRARDGCCAFPGCRRPARACDLDHTVPFDHGAAACCPADSAATCDLRAHPGGATSAANLGCLCRRHHRAKTLGHYQVRRDADGTVHWVTPLGRTYRTRPQDYRARS